MLHGVHKLTLTKDSVSEALADFVQKHMASSVRIQVTAWKAQGGGGYNAGVGESIELEFTQDPPAQVAATAGVADSTAGAK